jgi:F-type H+-transporting ATPase subunit delta
MVDLRVARRYARALFEVALKQGQLQATADDLRNLRGIMRESDELRAFFYSPLIPRDRKRDRLRAAFRERVQPHTMRTLELLVEKRREKMLDAVCDEFQKLQEGASGHRARTHPVGDAAHRSRAERACAETPTKHGQNHHPDL